MSQDTQWFNNLNILYLSLSLSSLDTHAHRQVRTKSLQSTQSHFFVVLKLVTQFFLCCHTSFDSVLSKLTEAQAQRRGKGGKNGNGREANNIKHLSSLVAIVQNIYVFIGMYYIYLFSIKLQLQLRPLGKLGT